MAFDTLNSFRPSMEKKDSKDSKETIEQKEFIKPELGIAFDKKVLGSLVERYPDQREMFEKFSRLPPVTFERGKVNFIFGPNGCGKSTLANAVFLAAEVAQRTQRIMTRLPETGLGDNEEDGVRLEDAQKEAMDHVLHPSRMDRSAVVDLIGMAAAPRLVEDGALVLTQFQVRGGYGGEKSDLISDTPTVHRIAVQDVLGEERMRENSFMRDQRLKFSRGGQGFSKTQSHYAESGASARQMVEAKLKEEFEFMNSGSIIIMDEAAFGLSPKRQEEYIKMLEQLAQEKDLIIIAPENSGYAFDAATARIDLENPERGLHVSEARDSEARAGVATLESREKLSGATIQFTVDQDKLKALIGDNSKFRPMLEVFEKLPANFGFSPGKTDIFADNASGKTTLLGVMYLLAQMERGVQSSIDWSNEMGREAGDKEKLRKEEMKSLVTNPSQPRDKVFIESLGLAREIIASGAITLGNNPNIPLHQVRDMEGVNGVMWMNLLDVSGQIKKDHFNIIDSSSVRDVEGLANEIKEMRPTSVRGSTRQTSETMLLQTIQHIQEGGFLFVDEIDGGISPGRQLGVSDAVHKLAKERGVTVIATSNSYEGLKYRITPSLDLSVPEQGVISPTHVLAETITK